MIIDPYSARRLAVAPPVRADATVDPSPLGNGMFIVTVKGQFPHLLTKAYHLAAKDDNQAAFEGLRLFTEAMRQGPITLTGD